MPEYAGKQSSTHNMQAAGSPVAASPGKRTLVEQAYADVQRRAGAGAGAQDEAAVHASAARGLATPASSLPHADQIQRSFGHHDVSSIQAHVGGDAAASAGEMGADAYAAGDHVVLGKATDLGTVAHEAAHVVQQRGGVQLKGGVGAAGDPHEQHADAVAARVVAGQSAETLLDQHAQHAGQHAGQDARADAGAPQVQHKTTIVDTDKKAVPGEGPGALESTDAQGKQQRHAVAFGSLVNDCGSSMDAWLYPDDDIKGTTPSVRPSWWVTMMADPATDKGWVSSNVVQGHLLNEHLGGPGNDMRNLTPFAKSTNSQHHAYVEKAAKAIKARGNILRYMVQVDYSSAPTAAWFGNKIAATYVAKFARGIKCVLEEYDGKTYKPIGMQTTTTVSNAISGQG
jgi:hypothetical protein